jgi:hypothetical protein
MRRKLEAERRKFERARMKHDEWVKPGGSKPIKHEQPAAAKLDHAAPIAKEQKQEQEPYDPNQKLIVDEWLAGTGGEKVLFEESEFYGTFNFRDTILRQLDRYWVYIERMKRNDPDAYGFYRKFGATVVPYCATHTNFKQKSIKKLSAEQLEKYKLDIYLTPWFKQQWPTFGCTCHGINPIDEERERADKGHLWIPKFMYFSRIDTERWPWIVQPVRGGKLYLMTVWWDRPDHKVRQKWGVPNDFPIWVSDDGSVIRALKTRESSNGIRAAHDWRIPYGYSEWAKQYGLTAQLHLTHLFAIAARDIEESYYATCRVEVSKGDLTAVFGIEPQRIPYFFQDRDVTLTAQGRKQRVFHSVRPHVRSDGTAVPMQFRGLREFEWAGYHVSITVPGRDYFLPQEFDVPVRWKKHKARLGKDDIRQPDVAEYLKKQMKAGLGAWKG